MADFQFEHGGQALVAVDAGFKESGYDVYDIETEAGAYVDNIVVHPVLGIEAAVSDWERSK